MTTPQAGRRYRRAAAFLIHWRDGDLGNEGAAQVLSEFEDDPKAVAAVTLALAELAWKMAAQGDPEAAMEYLRRVAAKAAVDEVAS